MYLDILLTIQTAESVNMTRLHSRRRKKSPFAQAKATVSHFVFTMNQDCYGLCTGMEMIKIFAVELKNVCLLGEIFWTVAFRWL